MQKKEEENIEEPIENISKAKGPKKQEIYEAWKQYKAKVTSTAQASEMMETSKDRKKKLKQVYGDNEHFNALGARWPVFSQTKIHHS